MVRQNQPIHQTINVNANNLVGFAEFMPRATRSVFAVLVVCAFAASASVTIAQTEETLEIERADTSRFFEEAHGALDDALEMFDDKDGMKAADDIAFYDFLSRSKETQEKKIETYLDAAADALGISSISDQRIRIAEMRAEIEETRKNLTLYERKKVSAPETSYNPLVVTRKGYADKIEAAKQKNLELEAAIENEKFILAKQLQDIGLKLEPAQIDILLESITGDEFVRVSIIFDNAKSFALELEELTEKTGEDLEAAKKYYGVYLMLLKTVDRLQNQFVENVDNVYYPKLDEFAEKAQRNIVEAKKAINAGADEATLRRNIESNELTYQATIIYKQGLAQQKHQMMMANLECKKNILTALNTYKTVSLSKDVAALMHTSRRAFEAITSLSVPDLRPFENLKMKEAFGEITRELRK